MSSADDYKAALREVIGPGLRAEGFRGSGSRWLASSPRSDVAVVNAQSSIYGSSQQTLFVINLAVVPEPWLAFQHYGRALPRAPKEHDGLWRDRLNPKAEGNVSGSEVWWEITDAKTAEFAAREALEQLRHDAVPRLRSLLHRDTLLASIRDGDLGFVRGDAHRIFFDVALAVLLADDGRSRELDDVLDRLANSDSDPARSAYERLVPWVTERLERVENA